MDILDITLPANHSKYLQGNWPDIRNRNVSAAILLSLMIHICGGWLFLQVVREAPNLRQMRTIEVTIVTPTVTPLPPPIMPKLAHQKSPPRSAPLPVPVVPPKPAPVIERVNQPQEIKKIAEKIVQPSQSLPATPSREKALAGSQPLHSPSLPRSPAPVVAANATGQRNGSEGLPVIGPSYDAAYLSNPAPQYPAAARFLKLQGTATLRVLVTPEGRRKDGQAGENLGRADTGQCGAGCRATLVIRARAARRQIDRRGS